MARFVALLGSINVGGNRLKMADLVRALEAGGFDNVVTVAASGNVLFDHASTDATALSNRLARIVEDEFGIETFAVVRTRVELERALAENPFTEDGEPNFVHVHFPAQQPSAEQFETLAADHRGRGRERLAPGTLALHIDFIDGVARSKLNSTFIERRLGCKGTARNINSLTKIIEKLL